MQQNKAQNSDEERARRLSMVLIGLYRGVVYREHDEDVWRDLIEMSSSVIDHFAQIGVRLVVDENEGYAYVAYPVEPDAAESENALPRLVTRRQLTFIVSLMLALLRKRMAEFDTAGEGTRLVMTRDEIAEIMRPFMPESTNEAKMMDKIDTAINKVKELGFIRSMKNQESLYEVMRILKAYIDAQWLNEFDLRLQVYRGYAAKGRAE